MPLLKGKDNTKSLHLFLVTKKVGRFTVLCCRIKLWSKILKLLHIDTVQLLLVNYFFNAPWSLGIYHPGTNKSKLGCTYKYINPQGNWKRYQQDCRENTRKILEKNFEDSHCVSCGKTEKNVTRIPQMRIEKSSYSQLRKPEQGSKVLLKVKERRPDKDWRTRKMTNTEG